MTATTSSSSVMASLQSVATSDASSESTADVNGAHGPNAVRHDETGGWLCVSCSCLYMGWCVCVWYDCYNHDVLSIPTDKKSGGDRGTKIFQHII